MLLEGHVQNGQIVVDEPASLPEGAKVRIELVSSLTEPVIPTVYERLRSVIGIAEGLPEDAARNHDHYLYGTPKKP